MSRTQWDKSKSGYAWEQEDRIYLASGKTFASAVVAGEIPDTVDPRTWGMKLDDQGSMSSCTGHAMTHCGEFCAAVDSKLKQRPQFSRMYAYIRGQMMSGIRGDNGATIAGVVKASMQYGLCPENLWPYPNPVRYSNKIPGGCDTAANQFKLLNHTVMSSANQCLQYLSSGYGAIIIGIPWTSSLANCTGKIALRDVKGRGGGHAVTLAGYLTRSGQRKLLLCNSHYSTWGINGWAEVDMDAAQYWCDTDCDLIGVTDVSGYDSPRKVDWSIIA